jgi:biopolymer transport protein ExbD
MSASQGESAEPDLTPMLDMVFQLITFFMLVLNVKAAAMDLELSLPVVGSAKPVKDGGAEELMVLNINKDGVLKAFGQTVGNDEKDIERFIAQEANGSLANARKKHPEMKPGDELPSHVVVRVDKATPFKAFNTVLATCQRHGFRNFSLKSKSQQK